MRTPTLALILMITAAPVAAEFTTEEKTEVRTQIEALVNASHSGYWLGVHLQAHPNEMLQVQEAIDRLTRTWGQNVLGILWLLDQQGGWGTTSINTLTRAQTRQFGINAITENSYTWVIPGVEQMSPSAGRTQALLMLNSAEAKRSSFNVSLAYDEPRVAMNIDFPGATRNVSANATPHGDYRQYGIMVRDLQLALTNLWQLTAKAAAIYPPHIEGFIFNSEKYFQIAMNLAISMGLAAGVEHPDVVEDIDIMFDGGSTARPRQFFRMQLVAAELMIGWDHLAPHNVDVFGRPVIRGTTYEMSRACRTVMEEIQRGVLVPEWARILAGAGNELCGGWAAQDGIVQNVFVFRGFTNLGRPPQIKGLCDPATTLLDLGPPPTCIGIGGGGNFTCGIGTSPVGSECIADIQTCGPRATLQGTACVGDLAPECPLFTASLDIAPEGITPKCVEIPQ